MVFLAGKFTDKAWNNKPIKPDVFAFFALNNNNLHYLSVFNKSNKTFAFILNNDNFRFLLTLNSNIVFIIQTIFTININLFFAIINNNRILSDL